MAQTNGPDLQEITIDDFREGIVSNIGYPGVSATTPIAVKKGMASESTTGCIANAEGFLTPLPSRQAGPNLPVSLDNTNTPGYRPVAFGIAGPIVEPNFSQNFGFDEIHIGYQYITGGVGTFTNNMTYFYYPNTGSPGFTGTLLNFSGTPNHLPNATLSTLVKMSWGMTWEYTRAINSTFGTSPGRPTSFTEWAEIRIGTNVSGPNGLIDSIVFPDPTAPANGAPNVVVPTSPLHYFTHDGRILAFVDSQYTHGPYTVLTNELIAYADPPNNWRLGTANTVLDPQEPTGFGAWGSISFGELLFIKRQSGALLISGDIYAPTITRMPGVQATGNCINKGTRCSAGLVYCVDADGAYLWNGGNKSEKISSIRDDFFVRANGNSAWGVQAQHCAWGPWVMFPNGWLWDSVNSGWWNIDQSAGNNAIAMVAQSIADPAICYAVQDLVQGVTTFPVALFNKRILNTQYTWASQPLTVSTGNQIDIMEMEIVLSSPVHTTTDLELGCYGITGTLQVAANTVVTLQTQQPQAFRFPCGIRAFNVAPVVIISSDNGTDPAPNVHSITVRYKETMPLGQGS